MIDIDAPRRTTLLPVILRFSADSVQKNHRTSIPRLFPPLRLPGVTELRAALLVIRATAFTQSATKRVSFGAREQVYGDDIPRIHLGRCTWSLDFHFCFLLKVVSHFT